MEHAEACAPDQPEVQGRDVGVAHERLRVETEDLRLEMREHANCPISTSASHDNLDPRVEPHAHEVFSAPLILLALEAPQGAKVRVKNDTVAQPFERLDAAREP